MFDILVGAIDSARQVVGVVEATPASAADAARLVSLFAELERLASAGRTLAVQRVLTTRAWYGSGHRTPAEWVAAETQSSMKEAVDVVETAARLPDLPATRAALIDGQLSDSQVIAVAAAASEVPSAEQDLLEAAARETVRGLRLECARVTAAALDDADRYERIRRSRHVRHRLEPDGAFHFEARLTPDAGAILLAAIKQRQQELIERGRKAGRREPREAYAADALIDIVRDGGRGAAHGPRSAFHVFCDLAALRRGRVRLGESCEIAGVGPVPVAAARQLLGDSFLELVLTKGRDVTNVTRVGRPVPVHVRSAVEARDRTCVVEGCDETDRLELDHNIPVWEGGVSSLENCHMLCEFDHYLKTYHGYRLHGPPGGPMTLIRPERRNVLGRARGDPSDG